ncbi:CCR4-NOT transcription complex subunit 6-like isoform X10 [Dermacentor silvarum]|uniref:CCR4-NOT transcription complex subunit 6-like isoform X10 n=1 Tax=Dermacentor silvarum TaxID=543639 RepID=UPI001899CE90|nr:CCR4-NOT transcription complex subunit 6-like isoform X10 [Dermacentor silvarum]
MDSNTERQPREMFYCYPSPPMSRTGCRDKDKEKDYNPIRRSHTIMCPEDVAAGKKSYWPELEITGIIRNLSPALWNLSHLRCLYLNDNCLSRLPPGIAQLVGLTHLDLSCNKLRSLPAELGDLVMLRQLHLNHNHLRVLPYELGRLFRLHTLGLEGNPLAPELVNMYNEPNGTSKLLAYLLENLVGVLSEDVIYQDSAEYFVMVTAVQPPQRPWVQVVQQMRSQPTTAFTVMCYNVLCDKYATRQVYGYCPAWALSWEYRRKGIMDEIRHYAADIISLQEVETEQFHDFFLPELKRDGYDGIFSPKSRAKTMSESDRKHVDGCAIFFQTSKFALIKEHLVEFNQLAMANADGSDDMLNRVMTKDNIGLAALLQFREGIFENATPEHKSLLQQQPPLLVCTAHIHWDPEYCDVKLIQTMMLMRELRTIVDDAVQLLRAGSLGGPHRRTSLDTSSIPLLLCGDMNSLPDSGVIEFLKTGHVSADHPDFKELGYKDCLRKMCLESDSLLGGMYTHPFKMKEAYGEGIMPYTNFTFDFKGVIDYIFFTQQHMSVLGVLGPLDPHWLQENKVVGCPHPHVPSDHLPLLAQLEMALVTNGLVQRR